MHQRIIKLKPPLLASEYIKEKITCIRGHRERIFNVSTQIQDTKLICNNYGQGGAGWTFLFGCVQKSIKLFEEQLTQNPEFRHKNIVIIGAGCYGLLTALILAHKNYKVRIVAQNIDNLSSDKAAGFFFPRPRKSSTPQEKAIFESTGIESYKNYLEILKGTHEYVKTGVKLLPAYYGFDIDPGFAPYIQNKLIDSPEQVTIDFGNSKTYQASEYKTIFINTQQLIRELRENIRELSIVITQQEITNFEELPESIVFNCTGLGAKKLTDDTRMVPVQGHLITLKDQPNLAELQYMINFKVVMYNEKNMPRDELIYYAPKESGILGITFMRGQDSLTTNQHEFERLIKRSRDFFGT